MSQTYRHTAGCPDYGLDVVLRLDDDGRFALEVEWTEILVGMQVSESRSIEVYRGVVEGAGETFVLAASEVETPEAMALATGEGRLPFPGPPCSLRFPVRRLEGGALEVGLATGGKSLLPWPVTLAADSTIC